MMSLPEQALHPLFRGVKVGDRIDGEIRVVDPRNARYLVHGRRIRDDNEIVLIEATRRLSLRFQEADHAASLFAHADRLSERIVRRKKLLLYGMAQNAHVGMSV